MDDLFAWISKRPSWQQEAVRRLTEQTELSDDDLTELQNWVESEFRLRAAPSKPPQPLKRSELRTELAGTPTTILGSIGPVKNVERLASDQSPLRFAVKGITLVYGSNGSGKSGYCRIAKSLCRSLHVATLRSNVFDAKKPAPPEICVTFKVAGEAGQHDVVWRQPDPPPPELSRISVFDNHAAALYVDGDRSIEFLPFELDLLNRLATSVLNLEERFKAREQELRAATTTPLAIGYSDGTDVSKVLVKLVGSKQQTEELPKEATLRAMANWTPENEERLKVLSSELQNDPAMLAKARRTLKSTLEVLATEARTLAELVGDQSVQGLKAKARDARNKRQVANASAKDIFKSEPIEELGGEAWRQMLRYAREFASEVFHERDEPRLAKGDVCVLCQQSLTPSARTRLASFDRYLEGRANKDAELAEHTLQEAKAAFARMPTRKPEDLATLLAPLEKLSKSRQQLVKATESFFEVCRKRLAAIVKSIKKDEYDELEKLEPLAASPTKDMLSEAAKLQKEADSYEIQRRKDGERDSLRLEVAELTDRRRLSTQIDLVVDRRSKLLKLARVSSCRAACTTTGITQQITRLRKELLTPSLQQSLQDEIDAFDLGHLPLKVDDWGMFGASKVQINLKTPKKVRNSEILSEGEQRGLALAGFLAELKEIGSTHGIIVDDPVSSLDHSRMDAVARRLVREAANGRQVIIFTHNLTFHNAVTSYAREAQVPLRAEWIAKKGDNMFGVIDDQQKPWLGLSVSERVAKIRAAIAGLGSTYNRADETNRRIVSGVYTMLRETWERLIEEVLFNDVIERFRPEVKSMRLRAAHVDEEDYKAVYDGMTRCSRFAGHDHAKEVSPELPKREDMLHELNALEQYVAKAQKRKKELENKGKLLERGPPIAEILQ